eukprot:m51a1_g384 hypothetical protein (371) ;mRNA; f:677554-678850
MMRKPPKKLRSQPLRPRKVDTGPKSILKRKKRCLPSVVRFSRRLRRVSEFEIQSPEDRLDTPDDRHDRGGCEDDADDCEDGSDGSDDEDNEDNDESDQGECSADDGEDEDCADSTETCDDSNECATDADGDGSDGDDDDISPLDDCGHSDAQHDNTVSKDCDGSIALDDCHSYSDDVAERNQAPDEISESSDGDNCGATFDQREDVDHSDSTDGLVVFRDRDEAGAIFDDSIPVDTDDNAIREGHNTDKQEDRPHEDEDGAAPGDHDACRDKCDGAEMDEEDAEQPRDAAAWLPARVAPSDTPREAPEPLSDLPVAQPSGHPAICWTWRGVPVPSRHPAICWTWRSVPVPSEYPVLASTRPAVAWTWTAM